VQALMWDRIVGRWRLTQAGRGWSILPV